jgi:hypothetical protein
MEFVLLCHLTEPESPIRVMFFLSLLLTMSVNQYNMPLSRLTEFHELVSDLASETFFFLFFVDCWQHLLFSKTDCHVDFSSNPMSGHFQR